jgi:tRNA(His) 5'-end guanylyltransferase
MTLGNRIKRYEQPFRFSAVRRLPLMIRVDGRAFHTFTRSLTKPFDGRMMDAMVAAALETARDMQGFKAAYVQSDEVTFCLTDYDTLETQGWFDYELAKVISISAATMSVWFNKYMETYGPVFDSRAFTVPISDVVNAFLWRAKDWKRNSIQMYCQAFFSHKQLHGKKQADMHEMLHSIGQNWANLPDRIKNGTFVVLADVNLCVRSDILPTYESVNEAIGHLFKEVP